MPLKRSLGLFELTLYGVGMIVGAGIYVLIGKVAALAGYGVWLSFLLSSLVAIFTGLSYAELSSRIKEDAAEYAFVKKTIKNSYLAYLAGWMMLASAIISGSTVALGFGGYLASLMGCGCKSFIYALLAIVVFTYINYKGISLSAKINDISTLLEVGGLLVIIFGVFILTAKGSYHVPDLTSFEWSGVINGAILAFFAYIGFGSLAKMSEEAKNPERNIPLAIVLSVAITTVLYVLVAIAAIIVADPGSLGISQEPAALIASKIHPSLEGVLSIIALFSTGNTLLLILISSSRLLYGLAKYKVFPSVFREVSSKTSTPVIAIVTVGVISLLLSMFKDIEVVAHVTNLWVFITYVLVNLSVIYLRKDNKLFNIKTGFTSPLNIGSIPIFAYLGIAFSLFMIFYPFLTHPFSYKDPKIWLTALLIGFATFYYYFREHLAAKKNFFSKLRKKAQASLEYLMVVVLSLLLLSPIIYYALSYREDIQDLKPILDVKRTLRVIKENSDFVFSQGSGSKITVPIVIPSKVREIKFGSNYVAFRLLSKYGYNDYFVVFPYTISGNFPSMPGTYNLIITAQSNGVVYDYTNY